MIDFDNALLIIVTVLLTEFGKDVYSKLKSRIKDRALKRD